LKTIVSRHAIVPRLCQKLAQLHVADFFLFAFGISERHPESIALRRLQLQDAVSGIVKDIFSSE